MICEDGGPTSVLSGGTVRASSKGECLEPCDAARCKEKIETGLVKACRDAIRAACYTMNAV